MKPEIKKLKNVRGRIVGYSASIGDVISSGATPKEASEKCERLVLEALERLAWGTLVDSWRGHTYSVAPTTEGWSYWLDTFGRKNDDLHRQGALVARDFYSVSGAWNTCEDARCSALHHLAQNLWEPTVNDDEFLTGLPSSVADELKGWIRFQREYVRLAKEGGRSDHEIHRLACEASYREPIASSAP